MTPLRVYIGFDSREELAYRVAEKSLRKWSSVPVTVTPLLISRLAESGLLRRPTDLRGQRYDILSNAPATTEFAISRFLVPILGQTGWVLFCDSDIVFLGDVAELFEYRNPAFAVMCVKHENAPLDEYYKKKAGQPQLSYPRKNWSSVMLWNCDHEANKRLSLTDVQERRGFDLHQLYWLHDNEIGSLPREWNWLVNMEPMPARPKIAHFTLGGPYLAGWEGAGHDNIWIEAAKL